MSRILSRNTAVYFSKISYLNTNHTQTFHGSSVIGDTGKITLTPAECCSSTFPHLYSACDSELARDTACPLIDLLLFHSVCTAKWEDSSLLGSYPIRYSLSCPLFPEVMKTLRNKPLIEDKVNQFL